MWVVFKVDEWNDIRPRFWGHLSTCYTEAFRVLPSDQVDLSQFRISDLFIDDGWITKEIQIDLECEREHRNLHVDWAQVICYSNLRSDFPILLQVIDTERSFSLLQLVLENVLLVLCEVKRLISESDDQCVQHGDQEFLDFIPEQLVLDFVAELVIQQELA